MRRDLLSELVSHTSRLDEMRGIFPAENIYKAFRASVDSRFPDYGKLVLLSFYQSHQRKSYLALHHYYLAIIE